MRRTIALSLIFGALLVGLVLGRLHLGLPGWTVILAAVAACVLHRTRWLTLVLITLALTLGVWRAEAFLVEQSHLTDLIGQKVTLTATIADDPGYDPRGFMDFKLDHLTIGGRPQPGQISARLYQINLHRGWRVQAEGKIKTGFGNMPVELSYPKITVLSTEQNRLERFRQSFFTGMKTALPEPVASFGLGLLVGVRALIPKPLQDQLALVGLSHLVAVSGYNLTIIVAAAHRLLERFGRGIALITSLWLIGSFLIVTGASASVVRASFVSVLALLAAFYGRRFHPLTLIVLTAALSAAYQPAYLTDIGWLLSFLAFFGIMILAPAVEARLGHPKNLLIKLFIESTTAQIMTIPIILYFFGDLSLVAPLTNLILLPMVPLAMLTSFVAGLAGMFIPAFAGWLAWPAGLLLGFMLHLITAFAALPWSGTTLHIDLITMLLMYAVLTIITIVVKQANARRHLTEQGSLLEPLAASPKPSLLQ